MKWQSVANVSPNAQNVVYGIYFACSCVWRIGNCIMMTRFQVFHCPHGNAGPTAMIRKTWKCNGPDTGPCTEMQSSFKSEVDLMLWDDGLESVRISSTQVFWQQFPRCQFW